MRRAALGTLSLLLLPVSASPDTRSHLAGELRSAVGLAPFWAESSPIGSFGLGGVNDEDVRTSAAALSLVTSGGSLLAVAQAGSPRHGARRVDPSSGRPLRVDAPDGATCATGSEDDCWHAGDELAGDRSVFDALCEATVGPATCLLERFGFADLVPASQSSYATVLAETTAGNAAAGQLLLGVAPAGLLALNRDPCDAFQADGVGGCNAVASNPSDSTWSALGPTLNGVLTDAQEALLGCGPFWGSDCEVAGIDLFRTEAGALGDPLESGLAPEALRDAGGGSAVLPGARGPDDAGYTPDVDGCPGPDAAPQCRGAMQLAVPDAFGSIAGRPYTREMNALAVDFQWTVGELSPGSGGSQFGRKDFVLFGFVTHLLPDEPSGLPTTRWLWESGVEYEIIFTSGNLLGFSGGVAHVLGLEVPERLGSPAQIGVPIVLVAPDQHLPDPSSPLVLPGTRLGFAYGVVVPEPGSSALAMAALATLVSVARAQSSPRLRRMRGSGASVSGSKARPVTCS